MNTSNGAVTQQQNHQLKRSRDLLHASVRALAIVPEGVLDLSTIGDQAARGPRMRRAVRGVISLPLGAVAWMLAALIGVMVARGALYGLVDSGPYDDAWGGPSLAGAWLTHFAISVPGVMVAAVAMTGIARLHGRLSRWVRGERLGWWTMPVVLVICAAAVVFFIAWLQQI